MERYGSTMSRASADAGLQIEGGPAMCLMLFWVVRSLQCIIRLWARICRNAHLAGTWAFGLIGHLLNLLPWWLAGGWNGQDSSIAEALGVAKARGGEAQAFAEWPQDTDSKKD
jgi:hypothetical protein